MQRRSSEQGDIELAGRVVVTEPLLRAMTLRELAGWEDPDLVVLEEIGLRRRRVRVDVMAVNGCLHGFEIKSERDSLRRLPSQVIGYSEVVDRATLVVAERHLAPALGQVPAWWEVLVARPRPHGLELVRYRRGCSNPSVNARSLVELLWYEEAVDLLRAHGAARGVVGRARRYVWDRICATVELPAIQAAVLKALKNRAATRVGREPSRHGESSPRVATLPAS